MGMFVSSVYETNPLSYQAARGKVVRTRTAARSLPPSPGYAVPFQFVSRILNVT
jgi:hypothetical protein